MYTTYSLSGATLPEKTLCLTYDDGPGEHTLEIASFLHAEKIRATFFMVGKYAVHQGATLSAMQQMGHIIGNHTYEHPDLPYYVSVDGDVQNQILRTDAIIRPYINGPVYFRAPYGKWSPEVANELNINLLSSFNHIGPIHWEIEGIDCFHWLKSESAEIALESYLTSIREKKRGIIVMHDDTADMDVLKAKNKTLQLTQQLIPILKKEGYIFIGLDEIEDLKKIATCDINLQAGNGKCISLNNDGTSLSVNGTVKQSSSVVGIIDLYNGSVALRAANGNYISASNDPRNVSAEKTTIEPDCMFHLIPVNNNRIMLRTYTGHFLTTGKNDNRLTTASAPFMRLAQIFTYVPLNFPAEKPLTLAMKFRLLGKGLAFIKSKVLSKIAT